MTQEIMLNSASAGQDALRHETAVHSEMWHMPRNRGNPGSTEASGATPRHGRLHATCSEDTDDGHHRKPENTLTHHTTPDRLTLNISMHIYQIVTCEARISKYSDRNLGRA
jgi:hypothetical protein